MKRILSCLLVVTMLTALVLTFASCENGPDKSLIGQYVYKDSVSTLATNWNPHTYETSDDSYPADFLRVGLYGCASYFLACPSGNGVVKLMHGSFAREL